MKNNGLYRLEAKINSRLKSLPADARPETSTRRKIRSVAYLANGGFEATASDGTAEILTLEQAKALLA